MITIDTDDLFEQERNYSEPPVGMNSIPRMFQNSVDRHNDNKAVLYKGGIYDRSLTGLAFESAPKEEYANLTYEEMAEIVRCLSFGFRELGLRKGDRIGILASTRLEWALCDFAVLGCGGVLTTLYTESSSSQISYLLDDSGSKGLIVENKNLLQRSQSALNKLDIEFVVLIDHCDTDDIDLKPDVYTLEDVYQRGKELGGGKDDWIADLDVDDFASLVYTSGTTGKPKGVKLSHRNIRSNINQVIKRFGKNSNENNDLPRIDSQLRTLSFLPLAHVFERMAGHFLMFANGVTVGYAQSPVTVIDDIQKVKPKAVTSVPRIYEKVYNRISAKASGSYIKRTIFEWARDLGVDYINDDNPGLWMKFKRQIAQRLMYRKVEEAFGGEIEFFVSGGGSLPTELAEIFKGMGLTILEGYGLTETSPVVTVNPPASPRTGTLGLPLVEVEHKIDEERAPEEHIEKRDGKVGELLVKGPNVTEGYWNKPDRTDEAFTKDGWFRTGDMVEETEDGFLIFVERLKEIIVLSTGKNIAPRPIESAFATSPLVQQIMVLGDDRKFISALIYPDFEELNRRVEDADLDLNGIDDKSLIAEPKIKGWIQREVDRINENFASHEKIKKFRLVTEEWTPENDLLTPSMKLKRRNLLEYYQDTIESIYE